MIVIDGSAMVEALVGHNAGDELLDGLAGNGHVALAEALGATLFTCDRKLGGKGHNARVVVLPRST